MGARRNVLKNLVLVCGSLCIGPPIIAQFNLGFRESNGSISISIDGQELTMPAAGGFNNPQVSEIDLDGNGVLDLFVFDRAHDIVRTFLYSSGSYTYAPQYEVDFPDNLEEFALLRDYDCDGKPDIFTYYQAGFRVYRNVSSNGNLAFAKVVDRIQSNYGSFVSSAFVLAGDVPAIVDIDGDNDLDILTFGTVNSENSIEFHRNLTQDLFNTCDSLRFEVVTQCWGNIKEPANSSTLEVKNCKGVVPPGPRDEMHPGSSILLIDAEGDGDKDLVVGDIQTSSVVFAINEGSAQSATIDVNQQTTNFPTAANPVNIQYLVAGYEVDVDHDGILDLLMTTNNTIDSSANTGHLWHYRNSTTSGVSYALESRDFLLDEMLDLGANSSVAVFDANADGLPDILIANDYSRSYLGYKNARLQLFIQEPDGGFVLDDDDVGQISQLGFNAASICLGDLDDDGDEDLLLGDGEGFLHYFQNDPSNGEANFGLTLPQYMGINSIGSNAAPTLGDVNGDGLLDLVIGERTGVLSYFQNQGSATNPQFSTSPTISEFGNIDVSTLCCTGHAVPHFVDNPVVGAEKYLFVGSDEKHVEVYTIANDLGQAFEKSDSVSVRAGRISPHLVDLDEDGIYELLCGTGEGGIKHLTRNANYPVGIHTTVHERPEINAYPNPADKQVIIELKDIMDGQMKLYSTNGQLVNEWELAGQKQHTLSTDNLATGIYILHLSGDRFSERISISILH